MTQWSDETLNEVFDRDDGCCCYCGRKVAWASYNERAPKGWEVEHGNPRSSGGVDDFRNIRLACWICNRWKSDMTPQQWIDILEQYYDGNPVRWYSGEPIRKHP